MACASLHVVYNVLKLNNINHKNSIKCFYLKIKKNVRIFVALFVHINQILLSNLRLFILHFKAN